MLLFEKIATHILGGAKEKHGMEKDIEILDEKRMAYLKWYLVGFAVFMILMLTRHFFRMGGLNSKPIGTAVLIGLFLTFLLQAICVINQALLERDIKGDPRLQAALHNELVKTIIAQYWIAAYIGTAGTTLFFAITWAFYPLCDPVTISLSSIIVGAGASRAYFYFRYKTL
jgi:hypothetical protein